MRLENEISEIKAMISQQHELNAGANFAAAAASPLDDMTATQSIQSMLEGHHNEEEIRTYVIQQK